MRVEIAQQGLPVQEVMRRLATGWAVFNVALDGPAIAVPGQPMPGPKRVDVWVEPPQGPVVPQIIVADFLRQALTAGGDQITLDWLSTHMFQTNIEELVRQLQEIAASAAQPVPDPEVPVQ